MRIGLGSVAAKSGAILLASTSPRLEDKNLNELLKIELLGFGTTSDSMDKDIFARKGIICNTQEKIFVLRQILAHFMNDLSRNQLIISKVEILKNRIMVRIDLQHQKNQND